MKICFIIQAIYKYNNLDGRKVTAPDVNSAINKIPKEN